MNSKVSAVIIKVKKGYIAELRFTDSSKDISLSSNTHQGIYKEVEEYVNNL